MEDEPHSRTGGDALADVIVPMLSDVSAVSPKCQWDLGVKTL